MAAGAAFYIEKADYCSRMAQRAWDDESREIWLTLAAEWLSLAESELAPNSRRDEAAHRAAYAVPLRAPLHPR